jgi:hypothetical protein
MAIFNLAKACPEAEPKDLNLRKVQRKRSFAMKTISQPTVITPSILVLALLFAAVVFIGATGKKVPILSNVRVDIILLIVIGMAMCTPGIGRVAASGQWTHPLSILAMVLGAAILFIAIAVFVGWKLPFIQNDQQALMAVAILTGLKLVNAVTHYLLSRAQ